MSPLRRKLMWGSAWAIGGFGVSQILRLATNIVLARLLAPEIFCVLAIVNRLRTGFELLSDVGISQNIVRSQMGAEPDFYSTAWTVQLIRGFIFRLVCLVATPLFAGLYGCRFLYVPILPGVRRELFGFWDQDLAATAAMLSMIGIFDAIRWSAGAPTLMQRIPLNFPW